MAAQPFRPRPIDVDKPLPIIRQDLPELEVQDLIETARTLPQMPTGMEAEEEKETHLQQIIQRAREQNEAAEIPTPTIKIVPEYDNDPNAKVYNRPNTYIHWKDPSPEEIEEMVEYDLEPEDYDFLEKLNTAAGKKVLAESKLETIMDRLEIASAKMDKLPSFQEVENLGSAVRPAVFQQIYNHWLGRRKKLKTPLNTRYLKPPDPEDPSPYRAFRVRTEDQKKKKFRKNDENSYLKLKQLRREMEHTRTLLEMIKKREKLKRDYLHVFAQVFDTQAEMIRDGTYVMEPEKKKHKKPKPKKDRFFMPQDEFMPEAIDNLFAELAPESPVEESLTDDEEFQQILGDEPTSWPPQENNFYLEESTKFFIHQLNPGSIFKVGRGVPSVRGRCRVGRGGRIIIDRQPRPVIKNGIVPYFETDLEAPPRLESLVHMYKNGIHPLSHGLIDAERLLKAHERMLAVKKISINPNPDPNVASSGIPPPMEQLNSSNTCAVPMNIESAPMIRMETT